MSRLDEINDAREKKPEIEVFNVRIVKCAEPILIKDESEDAEEIEQTGIDKDGYPEGYDDVFDHVYPPDEWEENGKTWRRVASTKSMTRNDMSLLQDEFRSLLSHWNPKMRGVCAIRRELYSQLFNELIRQVSVNNIDRGILLLRIRDEYKTIIEAYKQIFDDILVFSTKKAENASEGIDELELEVEALKEENILLNKKLVEANFKKTHMKENSVKEFNTLKAANAHELELLTRNHEAMKRQLEVLLTMKK